MILQEFERNPITKEGRAELMESLRIVWQERERQAEQEIGRIEHRIVSFKRQIGNHVDALLDPTNSSIKGEILKAVEKKKEELKEIEEQLYNLKNNSHENYERFLAYAFDFIEDIGGKFLDESTSQENRLRCKQIIFPSGFYVSENKKVYTPEKASSSLYYQQKRAPKRSIIPIWCG